MALIAGKDFTLDVTMIFTNTETRAEGEVRQLVFITDFFDEAFDNTGIVNAFAEEKVDDGAAGIFGLELVLEV